MARRICIPNKGRTVQEFDMEAAETFIDGAIVLLNASENVAEVAADPTSVLGIAIGDAAGRTVNATKMLVALPAPGRTFLIAGDNDPIKDDIGKEYGVVKDGDGIWHLDDTEVTTKVLKVMDIDLDTLMYEVEIIDSIAQL